MNNKVVTALALVAGLGLTACTNPYDPGQRAVGGGLLGAGAGAALGSIAGGGTGAAIGALAGGALGAVGGAATTPVPAPVYYPPQPVYPQTEYQQSGYPQVGYDQRGYGGAYQPAYDPRYDPYDAPPPPGYYRSYGY